MNAKELSKPNTPRAIILQSAAIEKIQIAVGLLGTTASVDSKAFLFIQDEALATLLKNQWAENSCQFQNRESADKFTDAYETGIMMHPFSFLKSAKEFENFSVYGCSTTCKIFHLQDKENLLDGIVGLATFLNLIQDAQLQIL